jgi:N-acetylmuramoyl-L-alanine amidase
MKMKLVYLSSLLIFVFIITQTSMAATTRVSSSPSSKPFAPLIYIDPGHQLKGNNELEPIGPDSKIKKAKVTSGTKGVSTKKTEYQLNLEVSLRLKGLLLAKGYRVEMTREKNDVNLSNKERALMANKAGADLFVRIHADGNDKATVNGISIQYPIANSSSKTIMAKPSKLAAEDILEELIKETGAKSRGIAPRSDLAGFNWSKVPSILVEMGFMTNKKEDILMSTKSYQEKLAKGIVNGIEKWLAEK